MTKNESNIKHIVLISILGAFIITYMYGWTISHSFWDWQTRGQFGDMFGPLTSMFSGLALSGLIISTYISNQQTNAQKFSEIFFKQIDMLKVEQEKVSGKFQISGNLKVSSGTEFFESLICQELMRQMLPMQAEDREELEAIRIKMGNLIQTRKIELSKYNVIIFGIFDYINTSPQNVQKKFYYDILRSQLSQYELLYLFYYVASLEGQRFSRAFIIYKILQDLDSNLIIHTRHKDILAYLLGDPFPKIPDFMKDPYNPMELYLKVQSTRLLRFESTHQNE